MPNPYDVIRRAAELLKPGGWFLAEDGGPILRSDHMRDEAKRLLDIVSDHWVSKGFELQIGYKIQGLLRDTNLFDEVHTTQVHLPFSPGIYSS
jgi:hypothetical protein